jgi:hypothetical protein
MKLLRYRSMCLDSWTNRLWVELSSIVGCFRDICPPSCRPVSKLSPQSLQEWDSETGFLRVCWAMWLPSFFYIEANSLCSSSSRSFTGVSIAELSGR